jgi:uncharacterized membrane protein
MSDLIAIVYPDVEAATEAEMKLLAFEEEEQLELEDALVVERRPDGWLRVTEASGARSPRPRKAAGRAARCGAGSQALGNRLKPGGAALFLLVGKMNEELIARLVAPMGGELLRSTLGTEGERRLLTEASRAARASA